MRLRLLGAVSSFAFFAGCMPNTSGLPCATDNNCPTGQVCRDQVCVSGSGGSGGGGGGTNAGGGGGNAGGNAGGVGSALLLLRRRPVKNRAKTLHGEAPATAKV